MLTSSQMFALIWAVTCVAFQFNTMQADRLKRRRASENFQDARTVAEAEAGFSRAEAGCSRAGMLLFTCPRAKMLLFTCPRLKIVKI